MPVSMVEWNLYGSLWTLVNSWCVCVEVCPVDSLGLLKAGPQFHTKTIFPCILFSLSSENNMDMLILWLKDRTFILSYFLHTWVSCNVILYVVNYKLLVEMIVILLGFFGGWVEENDRLVCYVVHTWIVNVFYGSVMTPLQINRKLIKLFDSFENFPSTSISNNKMLLKPGIYI